MRDVFREDFITFARGIYPVFFKNMTIYFYFVRLVLYTSVMFDIISYSSQEIICWIQRKFRYLVELISMSSHLHSCFLISPSKLSIFLGPITFVRMAATASNTPALCLYNSSNVKHRISPQRCKRVLMLNLTSIPEITTGVFKDFTWHQLSAGKECTWCKRERPCDNLSDHSGGFNLKRSESFFLERHSSFI